MDQILDSLDECPRCHSDPKHVDRDGRKNADHIHRWTRRNPKDGKLYDTYQCQSCWNYLLLNVPLPPECFQDESELNSLGPKQCVSYFDDHSDSPNL